MLLKTSSNAAKLLASISFTFSFLVSINLPWTLIFCLCGDANVNNSKFWYYLMIKKVQKKRKETHSVTIARASSMLFAFKYQLNITLMFSLNIFYKSMFVQQSSSSY